MKIKLAATDTDLLLCFPAMQALRPFLKKEDFLPRIKRLMKGGYQIAFVLLPDGTVPAVAGFRFEEMLHRGNSIYIDDLSTLEESRSKGYGGMLIDYLINLAKEKEMHSIHLDSGVQRFDAHRFYLKKKFNITSHHFALQLKTIE
ncbi:MAG TPA: GNAT family N-acetyltransferase [Bacteroidia bacterium]|nr:GNAT family N-acetyltransferase [Bacteroidia bacterium]